MLNGNARLPRFWASLVSLALLSTEAGAQAEPQPPRTLFLDVKGACPSSMELERELTPLLSGWTLADSSAGVSQRVSVTDGEDELEVVVASDRRVLVDPNRDCAERARAAAVIIALRLDPPQAEDRAVDEDASVEPEAKVPREEPETDARLELGIGGILQKPLDSGQQATLGPFAAVRWVASPWSAELSVGFLAPVEVTASGLQLRVARVPMDAGVGWELSRSTWSVQPLLLVAFDYFLVSSPDLDESKVRGRLDLGPRLGLRLGRNFGGWSGFGRLDFTWFPRDYQLDVQPLGTVSRTPHSWFGCRLGLSLPVWTE